MLPSSDRHACMWMHSSHHLSARRKPEKKVHRWQNLTRRDPSFFSLNNFQNTVFCYDTNGSYFSIHGYIWMLFSQLILTMTATVNLLCKYVYANIWKVYTTGVVVALLTLTHLHTNKESILLYVKVAAHQWWTSATFHQWFPNPWMQGRPGHSSVVFPSSAETQELLLVLP